MCVHARACVCVFMVSWVAIPSVGDRVVWFGRCTALSQQRGSCFSPAAGPPHAGEIWQSVQLTFQNPIGHKYTTTIPPSAVYTDGHYYHLNF